MVANQLAFTWGVETLIVPSVATTDEMVQQVDHALHTSGRADIGERIVIVAGSPQGRVGTTNTIRVHVIGGQPTVTTG